MRVMVAPLTTIWYVRTLRASRGSHAANDHRRNRFCVDRPRALRVDVLVAWNGQLRARLVRTAMTLRARAVEHGFALLFEAVEWRVGIGERRGPGAQRVCNRPDAVVREQHPFERGQVVQQLVGRRMLYRGVVLEGAERLFLERRHARIELISAERIGARNHWLFTRSGPESATLFTVGTLRQTSATADSCTRHRVDDAHVRRQREHDTNQPVLPQIAEVAGLSAVFAEVVRVDRPE